MMVSETATASARLITMDTRMMSDGDGGWSRAGTTEPLG
jgi:hypothetical protein